jgi:uncharacterized protein (TIGR02246 family)
MSALTAQAISEQLAAAINSGEVASALELWEADAKLISREGVEAHGREAIGAVLESLVSNGAQVEIELRTLHESATTAVATGTLTMRIGGSEDQLTQSSDSLVVYRRGQDGYWRVAIDFPWGVPTG